MLRNFKFNLKLDLEEAPLTTYYCEINGSKVNLELLAKMKEMNVDILKCFAEDCYLYYYDPSSLWRVKCDFNHIMTTLGNFEERMLAN